MKRIMQFLYKYIERTWNPGRRTIRMHVGLHIAVLGIAMIFGITVVLFLTDNIFPGQKNVATVITQEVSDVSASVEEHLNGVTAEAINFAETISADIEYRLSEEGITFTELQTHPEMLSDILDRETDRLILALERANCSGVYLALNATINPDLPAAEMSRAGIYIRRVEPKRISSASEMLYLRGFTSFAQRRSMTLQANWDLEFNISEQAFWELPLNAHEADKNKKMSDLYVWFLGKIVPESKGNSLVCSIPLLSGNGDILGVCGFEITAASFRYHHMIDLEKYPEFVLLLSAEENGKINTGASGTLFSGNKVTEYKLFGADISYTEGTKDKLGLFQTKEETYFGRYKKMSLYHDGAYYSEQQYSVMILLPESEYNSIVRADIIRAVVILTAMLVLGIVVSMFLSKRIMKPFDTALDAMSASNANEKRDPTLSVGIKELDELLQLFSKNYPGQIAQIGNIFEDFLDKLRTLTPAERAIVACYTDGKDFETVMKEMCIASGTLKTHNSHIYKKLDINGANEIKLYLNLINSSNLSDQLTEILRKAT